jgi:ABC-type antimicrobial peptide transport system permease subunit
MIKNYLKVAIRSLMRNKSFSVINIAGLAIGMASAILILLWVQNEISYDRFHTNSDRLYEVWGNETINGTINSTIATPEIMQPALKKEKPEIDKATRVSWPITFLFQVGKKSLQPTGNFVDPDFLTMFSFPMLRGNVNALESPYSVVLTESLAKKLFGDQDPMGKSITIQRSQDHIVTGILKDPPNNTQFNFEYLLSYNYNTVRKNIDEDWTDISIRTFVTLKPNASFTAANSQISNFSKKHSGGRSKSSDFLYPVSQLRLYSNFVNGKPVGGLITTVRTFILIATFILLIACINFMNLSTARSEKRAREVGIRKVAGALKRSLILQFLLESVLIALVAGILAITIVEIALPQFNILTEKQLSLNFGSVGLWISAVGFILLTGILAGSYPAFFLSAFNPVAVLKGTFQKINALITPRKILVVLQFSFAIALIICTIIIKEQIKFAQERNAGYNKKDLGYVFMQGDLDKNFELVKNDLLNSGAAISVAKTMAPMTQNWSAGISMKWQGSDPNANIQINRYTSNGDMIKTMGLKLVQGRDIDVKNYPTDSTACLISESAVKVMGFKNPIGQIIYDEPDSWHVVGVINDFILESPYEAVKPFMVKGPKYGGNTIHMRLNPANSTAQNLAKAEKIFKKYNPAYPFQFVFIDKEYEKKFTDERLIGTLASLFAGLTIFISCLGLFGLATFMAEKRIKEIGIRKLLGASVSSVTALLSKDFLKLVMIAIAIASPVAWWAMQTWLQGYTYRIKIGWWVFAGAGLLSLIISFITVSFQAIKAALANPAKSLKTE